MQNVDDYNLALTTANVNNVMQKVLDDIKHNERYYVDNGQTLADAINRNMRELAQIQDEEKITEIKQYEFSCEIELYPMVQYVEANTAEEAMELMEKSIEESILDDLDARDFHCVGANIVKETKEYKNWIKSQKEQL
jgi:hypothetical protein